MSTTAPDEQPAIAAAVIVHDGKVLLVKRRVSEGSLSWQFPAGAVEKDETPADAAVREAQEEAGLVVAVSRTLGERVHPNTGRKMIYFACRLVDGEARVKDEEELDEIAWSDHSSLPLYLPSGLFDAVNRYLESAIGKNG